MKEEKKIKVANNELNQLEKLQANTNKIKACLFNLIVYTHEPAYVTYFKKIAHMIMEIFPCRVMFIHENRMLQAPFLKIHVNTEELVNPIGMVCDEINIEASTDQLARVPFLILPYFVPELPIYFIWGQDPTQENSVLSHLQKYATRLIFDSDTAEDFHHFSQMMLERLKLPKPEIMDINWARIGGWRELLAQTFDNLERIQQLASTRTLKILYNNRPTSIFAHSGTQALYLQAWLAAQLKWRFERIERKSQKTLIYYHYEDHSILVTLQPQLHEDLPPNEILAIEISGEEQYLCTMERRTDTQVVVNCSTQYQCLLPFTLTLTNIRSGRNFMQEVLYQKPSEHYVHMLSLISHIEGT